MVAATKSAGFAGYQTLVDSDDGVYSDATLTILNSKKNSNKILTFRDMFPITLGAINMDVTTSDITYSTFDVTFKYNPYGVYSERRRNIFRMGKRRCD
jgi:hypothetical protein